MIHTHVQNGVNLDHVRYPYARKQQFMLYHDPYVCAEDWFKVSVC